MATNSTRGLVRNATGTGWLAYGPHRAVLITHPHHRMWCAQVVVFDGGPVPQHQESCIAQGPTLRSIIDAVWQFVNAQDS